MKTVAVTGCTGFVGGGLSKALLAAGYGVRIISRGAPRYRLPGAEYAEASFSDVKSLEKAVAGCDAVFHLAAALFCRSAGEFMRSNATGTANLVAACEAARTVKKIIYLSSLAAGGPSPDGEDRDESRPDAPVSAYGRSKRAGEEAVRGFRGGPSVTLRPPIVYGKKDFGLGTIASWVKRGVMVNAGSASGRFSFVYLDDLVRALLLALETPAFDGGTFYVCERRTYEWREFIALLARGMGARMPLMISLPPWAVRVAGAFYELVTAVTGGVPALNRDKAKEAAGPNWTASPALWEKTAGRADWTPLEEGIRKTFDGEPN
jgi:nucleoside-diphosphate-sugar epimerase